MKFTAVLDACSIIALVKGGVFYELAALYDPLWVPPGVTQEITVLGAGLTGDWELRAALGSWITEAIVPAPPSGLATPLSGPDREVVAVALSEGVDHLITDDQTLAREAAALGLTCLNSPLVVVILKQVGFIPAVRPVLDRMRQEGFGINPLRYQEALTAAGE